MKFLFFSLLFIFNFLLLAENDNSLIEVQTNSTKEKLISEIIFQLEQDIGNFQRSIGYYDNSKLKIAIARNKADYENWTKNTSEIIEFSLAFYDNQKQMIFIREPSSLRSLPRIRRILLHEYIHHFVNLHIADPPLWFNEGMAVYFSGDLGMDREFNFVKNYFLGNSRPLRLMKYSYPKNRIEWESFYAKSGLAVKYLFLNRKEAFYRFWDFVNRSGNFDSAFIKSFHITQDDFSALFEEYARNHSHAGIFIASSSVIWGLLPLILIIGVVRKKFKTKKIAENWQEENPEEMKPRINMNFSEEDESETTN